MGDHHRRKAEGWMVARGKGWTAWRDGRAGGEVHLVWWQARQLHFLKENITHWYDGSELVAIERWEGVGQWCMKRKPADWQPRPPGHMEAAERAWLAYRTLALHRERHTAHLRCRKWPLDPLPRWCWAEV